MLKIFPITFWATLLFLDTRILKLVKSKIYCNTTYLHQSKLFRAYYEKFRLES